MKADEKEATVDRLADIGALPPRDFSDVPHRVREISDVPLDLPGSLAATVAELQSAGHFDPSALEEAVVALCMGNLILSGPPGTGKTSLARALAKAFNVTLVTETANPEWSVYDVIGTQTLNSAGGVVARHGLVTSSILQCAGATVDNLDAGEGPQAAWLLIDEMNRADIDRAFGPLFTALAGGPEASMILDYHGDRPQIVLPKRYRIIATVNEYDNRFVNSMSGALRRRFSKVAVLPPSNLADGRSPDTELNVAITAAKERVEEIQGQAVDTQLIESLTDFRSEICRLFGYLRAEEGGNIPVGTAQLIDVITYYLVLGSQRAMAYENYRSAAEPTAFWSTFDRALVARLLPSLETDSTRARMEHDFAKKLTAMFPDLPNTFQRIESFLYGRD